MIGTKLATAVAGYFVHIIDDKVIWPRRLVNRSYPVAAVKGLAPNKRSGEETAQGTHRERVVLSRVDQRE